MQQETNTTTSQASGLLRCLSCLDVDAWAHVLLPKLVKQGSARDVALTCTQLRDLCYGTVKRIDLSSLVEAGSGNAIAVQSWVQSIPQHFPNCTSVQLLLQDDASYVATPYMLPVLARLPKFKCIKLKVKGVLQPVPMCLVLHILRTHLPGGLRCLYLNLKQSWAGATDAWQELGQFTGLSKLHIDFGNQAPPGSVGEQDLLPLANLCSLQHLAILSLSDLQQPLLSARLVSSLTSLTCLVLSGCPVSRLRHLSSCVALKVLDVGCPMGVEEELGPVEWGAVAELTRLEKLSLLNANILSVSDECCAALAKLSRLQRLAAWTLSADILPALTACTQLTALKGGWREGSSGVAGAALPSVVELWDALNCPPFAALPNLLKVVQTGSLSAAALMEMARHCTRLQEIVIDSDWVKNVRSLKAGAPLVERIAAVKALSGLTSLTMLDWSVRDSAELAALVNVVGTLLPAGVLRYLAVCLDHATNELSVFSALMHLAKLQGLRQLRLVMPPAFEVLLAGHAADLLGALSGVHSVVIVGVGSEVKQPFMAAWDRLGEVGLPRPKILSLTA